MWRWAVAMTGLALLGLAGGVQAKGKLEPRTRAMLECRAIEADDARLRCYDQSMSALKEAIDQGDVVLDQKGPTAREGIVKSSGKIGENTFWIVLESGDRWKLLPTIPRKNPPTAGSSVKVRKSLSGYWISAPDWNESKADFEGHGS